MLIRVCGTSGRIDGLTKLAKLDFFVRYPSFFDEACEALQQAVPERGGVEPVVEAPMVRHHYGPWDKRYYQVLAFLEGAQLVVVDANPNGSYRFTLTDAGKTHANSLLEAQPFASVVAQMRAVKRVLGARSGDSIKKLIYRIFDSEVAKRLLGDVIR